MTAVFKVNSGGMMKALKGKQIALAAASRPAAQAMAQVFYEAALQYVPVGKHAHWFYGSHSKKTGTKYFFSAGNLKRSIYQVHSKSSSVDGGKQVYHISWNHSKAPYGYMVEFGTSKARAHPFMRPAQARADSAFAAGKEVLVRALQGK